MSVAMPEEIDALRESVRRFMEAEVNPFMNDIEKTGRFPRELVKRPATLASMGQFFQNQLAAPQWVT